MNQITNDMTLAEIFSDPLILAVMRADGIALKDFKDLMYSAARSLKTRDGKVLVGTLPKTGPTASPKRALVATMQPLFARSFGPCTANL